MELRNATEVLPAGPQAPSLARRFVAKTLDSWDHADLSERAVLAVSELVTNAFLYGEGDIVLVVMLGVSLRIEVRDGGAGLPTQRNYSPSSTTGRGLHLVGHMTDRWGTSAEGNAGNAGNGARGGQGKVVWFEIDTPAPGEAQGVPARPVVPRELAGERPAKGRPRSVDQARSKMAV